MPSIRPALIAALAAATVLPAAAAHAAQSPIDSLQVPTPVAGFGAVAMWSQLDAQTGEYRLVESVGGKPANPVHVPERPKPFDVDLGTNRIGQLDAVYTRDGDVYRLNTKTDEETELTHLSSPTLEERDPTIEAGRVAFIRRDGGSDQVRVGNISGSGTKLVVKAKAVDSVELGSKQIAYVAATSATEFGGQAVHVRNLASGHDQTVFAATAGGASSSLVTKPSFVSDGSAFVFARSRNAAPGNQLIRYTLRTGKLSFGSDRQRVVSSAWLDDDLGAVTSTSLDVALRPDAKPGEDCDDAGQHYCDVALTGPVSFDQAQKK